MNLEGPVPVRDVLGVPVLAATREEAVAALDALARKVGATTLVAFLNAHASNVAARDARFRAVMSAALVLPDGIGVDIASRFLHGAPFPANLNGTDFVPAYLVATGHSFRIALYGARPGVAERAAEALARIAPRHTIVCVRHGYGGPDEKAQAVADLAAAAPDVLLVALGNPAQELFIAAEGARIGARLAFGVGALFDFLAGEAIRAPEWVRRWRLEWAWRLAMEPGRLWKRYVIGNPWFLLRVLRARLAGRSS